MSETHTPIRVPSYGPNQLSVDGLKGKESDMLRASLLGGHHWIRRDKNGRLQHVPSFEPLPGPVTDEEMLPFWRKPSEVETRQADLFGFDTGTEASLQHASPSIYISNLCGYHYSAENYKREADKLTSWGFVCMRSLRDTHSGQYWEVWYMPGVWFAKGQLNESIARSDSKSPEEKFKQALEFLRRNSSFGSLDVSMQRMAMVMED